MELQYRDRYYFTKFKNAFLRMRILGHFDTFLFQLKVNEVLYYIELIWKVKIKLP